MAEIAALLRAIEDYSGTHVVRCALRLAPLTFTRPGEIRQAEWAYIDLAKALWIVPADVKKQTAERKRDAGKVHLAPLSKQAVAILEEIKPLTGHGRYVFPSARSPKGDRPMSSVALLAALRRMGYSKEEMTAHGFRGIASTLLREAGRGKFRHEVIEAQLAHAIRNSVEAAYNHAEYMDERPAMMQWWADYLDSLKVGADVISFRRTA